MHTSPAIEPTSPGRDPTLWLEGAENPPREIRDKVEVIERGDGMVLAAHRTRSGPLTTVTLESVTFVPPEEIRFHLVRGPVPHVEERFALRELEGGSATELVSLAGRVACLAEALSLDGTLRLLEDSGLRVCGLELHGDAVVRMAQEIDARLAVLAATGIAGRQDLGEARRLARSALRAAEAGIIGYALVIAET